METKKYLSKAGLTEYDALIKKTIADSADAVRAEILTPESAVVGQAVTVAAVDTNGKPTALEAKNLVESWNDLADKPFGSETAFIFDGNCDGRDTKTVDGSTFVKVCDTYFSTARVLGATIYVTGWAENGLADMSGTPAECTITEDMVFEGTDGETIVAPAMPILISDSTGTYVLYAAAEVVDSMFGGSGAITHDLYASTMTVINTLDEKFIPDTIATEEYVDAVKTDIEANIPTNVVQYGSTQSLTAVQKTQARTNIGTVGLNDLLTADEKHIISRTIVIPDDVSTCDSFVYNGFTYVKVSSDCASRDSLVSYSTYRNNSETPYLNTNFYDGDGCYAITGTCVFVVTTPGWCVITTDIGERSFFAPSTGIYFCTNSTGTGTVTKFVYSRYARVFTPGLVDVVHTISGITTDENGNVDVGLVDVYETYMPSSTTMSDFTYDGKTFVGIGYVPKLSFDREHDLEVRVKMTLSDGVGAINPAVPVAFLQQTESDLELTFVSQDSNSVTISGKPNVSEVFIDQQYDSTGTIISTTLQIATYEYNGNMYIWYYKSGYASTDIYNIRGKIGTYFDENFIPPAIARTSDIPTTTSQLTNDSDFITSTDAKSYADTAATNAANTVKNDLLNGAGAAYDTLKELGDLIDTNQDAIEALNTVAAGKADKEHTHTKSQITDFPAALSDFENDLFYAAVNDEIVSATSAELTEHAAFGQAYIGTPKLDMSRVEYDADTGAVTNISYSLNVSLEGQSMTVTEELYPLTYIFESDDNFTIEGIAAISASDGATLFMIVNGADLDPDSGEFVYADQYVLVTADSILAEIPEWSLTMALTTPAKKIPADVLDIEIPEIPATLPNPYSLTFYGSVTDTYNGSATKTVPIYNIGRPGEGGYAETFNSGCDARGTCAHAEGLNTTALGDNTHTEGKGMLWGMKLTGEANATTYTAEFSDSSRPFENLRLGMVIENALTKDWAKITDVDYDNHTIVLDKTISTTELVSSTGCYILVGVASGNHSHAEGCHTTASGNSSHAEGTLTVASGSYSHAEGYHNNASGEYQHVQGKYNIPDTTSAHIVGNGEYTDDRSNAHTLDWDGNAWFAGDVYVGSTSGTNKDSGSVKLATVNDIPDTSAFMSSTDPVGTGSFSMNRLAGSDIGTYSHAEGYNTTSSGAASHAEGRSTTASGNYSHAEGRSLSALPDTITASTSNTDIISTWYSTYFTLSKGSAAHAEGESTLALGDTSHAEGYRTIASGDMSHAEGYQTTASGSYSHAEGYCTTANDYQHVSGKYNESKDGPASEDTQDTAGGDAVFIVGCGTSIATKNGFRVTSAGKCYGAAAFGASGADFAELFEWADGNPDSEDRRGLFVTLEGNKIRLANADDDYVGIISGSQAFIGNSASEEWQGKYLTDVFGAKLSQEIEVLAVVDEETGEVIRPATKTTQYVLNPEYDPSEPYIMRENRKEWGIVGLIGQIVMVDDGSCVVGGRVAPSVNGIGTASTDGYRVMRRIDENHIEVLVK